MPCKPEVDGGEGTNTRGAPESGAGSFEGFERHYAPLRRFAYLISGGADIARDLTHDALVRFIRAEVDLTTPKARSYLGTTVANLLRRRLRRLALEARALIRAGPTMPPPAPEEASDDRDRVWRALRKLRYEACVCPVLGYYEDLSPAQIAEEWGDRREPSRAGSAEG